MRTFMQHKTTAALAAAFALALAACGGKDNGGAAASGQAAANGAATAGGTADSSAAQVANAGASQTAPTGPVGPASNLPPNELGTIMVLEYHRLGDKEGEWYRSRAHFQHDLETLYQKGYRPVTMRQVADGDINLPAGTTPVVFVFDDSSLGQFYYLPNGQIDPNTMVGMWTAFKQRNPAWSGGGTFCVLPGAEHPSNFWGEKKSKEVPKAQREAEIKRKVDYVLSQGHEICNHTMWHAKLSQYPDAFVQDQIGSGIDSISHYLPADYKIVTFALPLGLWPKNRQLAWHGTYRNGKTYTHQTVLEVSGGPNESPFDARYDPHSVNRVIAAPGALEAQLAAYDRNPGSRYVSDGDPRTVTYPQSMEAHLGRNHLGGRTPKAVAGGAAPAAAPAKT
jgi:hypothetical protein